MTAAPTRRATATLAATLGLLAIGCGASRHSAPRRMDAIVGEAAGTQLVVLPRATRGRVWLSLWIDAGARDADPPQVATVAAWVAATDGISVEVLPDGIALTRACDRDALDACLRSLRAAVATRDPSAEAVAAARERLVATRRRASGDEARRADALAMEALLGRRVDPLGDAADDARVTARAVGAFLRAHAGAGRMLLVAIGDLDATDVRAQVSAIFGDLPRAEAQRAAREPREVRAIRVDVGAEGIIAAATLRPSITDAALRARTLVARIDATAPRASASADVFPIRGGAALIARVRGDGAALLDQLAPMADAPPVPPDDPPPPRDGPRALARWIGALWISKQEPAVGGGLGVGAVVPGGRGDRMDERDPDAALREEARAALEARLRAASEPARGDGTIDEEHAELVLPSGARLFARRLAGASRVSALVLFAGGAAEDPPEAHGTTALLAQVARVGCERVATDEIGESLASLGVRVDPILRADEWGLAVEGPTPRWREVAYLATRCASAPYLEPATLERAREPLVAMVQRPRDAARATAARAITPTAPGRIAPLGERSTLSRVSLRQLRRARAVQVASARARIAIAGDVPIDEVASVLSRGAARWPEGASHEPDRWADPSARLAAARHPEGRHEALIGWVADAPASGPAADAFARAALRALSGEPGLRARWHEGGASAGRAWALVSLDATPDALDALPAHVARALSTVAWTEVAAAAVRVAEEQRAWAESSPRGVAAMLVREAAEPPSPQELERVLARLEASEPFFVIVRPQPGARD